MIMKVLNLILLLILLACCAAAQTPSNSSDAPGVTVIKNKWSKAAERNLKLEQDPLRVNQEQAERERALKDALYENNIRVNAKLEPIRLPMNAGVPNTASGRSRVEGTYIYEIKISNTGPKIIREVIWEYVFTDPDTGRTVGRHQFTNKVNLRPGKKETLVGRSVFTPDTIVDVSQSGVKSAEQYSERVVIKRIKYMDGSVWERPSR
jgi:hypothetical protein